MKILCDDEQVSPVAQGLNDRFAMFIDKVRNLEQQNKVLETELVTLRQKQSEPSRIAQLYQQEMKDLRSQLEELSRDKNRILIERNNMEDELQVKLNLYIFSSHHFYFSFWALKSPLMSHFRSFM